MDYPNNRDCEHGRLRRSCEICEMEEEIDRLKAEIEGLKTQLEVATSVASVFFEVGFQGSVTRNKQEILIDRLRIEIEELRGRDERKNNTHLCWETEGIPQVHGETVYSIGKWFIAEAEDDSGDLFIWSNTKWARLPLKEE